MAAFHRYTCPLPGCGYPIGECPGSCLVPDDARCAAVADPCNSHLVPVWHDLPIDLVEPDAPAPVGDPVPRHLFMPLVPWRAPLPPVIRSQHRRDHWLTEPPPVRVDASTDLLEPAGFGVVAALSLGTWCLGAALLVAAHLKGWL